MPHYSRYQSYQSVSPSKENAETFGKILDKGGIIYDEATQIFSVTKCSQENCTNELREPKKYKDIMQMLNNANENQCLAHKVIKRLKE